MVSLSTNLVEYSCLCFSFAWSGAIWCPKVASEKKNSCFTGKQFKKIHYYKYQKQPLLNTHEKVTTILLILSHLRTALLKIINCSKLVWFPFLYFLIGWKLSLHFLNQSAVHPAPIVYWSHIFFGAWYQLNRKIPHTCPSVFTIPRITNPINSRCKKSPYNK